jgi:hypothetical protein
MTNTCVSGTIHYRNQPCNHSYTLSWKMQYELLEAMEKCEALATSSTLPHSHQLLSAIVVICSGLLRKCGATWLHNRCVWTGNKLPDTTKIQVKLEAVATAVRQRKSEISGYDVPMSSLLTLLIYILILSTYVDLTYNRKRSQVVPTRIVGLQHCSLSSPRFLPFNHLLTPSIGSSHKVATITIA